MQTSHLRQIIDRNRQEERRQYVTDYQKRSRMSLEELAIYLNRKCVHCGELITPLRQIPDEWRGEGHFLTIWPDSHDCEAERQAKLKQTIEETQAMAEAWNRDYLKRLENAGLTGWLAQATFDSFVERQNWAAAMKTRARVMAYVNAITSGQREKPFLILYGAYGTGKTHLAAASVRWFVDLDWHRCYFRVWPGYLKRIQASWDRRKRGDFEGESEEEITEELQSGQIVVIDDLDKKKSDWTRSTLFPAINERYNQQLPTIFTFNYGPADADPQAPGRAALEEFMGRAVLDRVIGASWDVIEFNGPSYRSGLELGVK